MTQIPSITPLKKFEETNGSPITASIIWLHGLGADGSDFKGVHHELQLPSTLGVRFIFPNAPLRTITINNGMSMPAWYDILSLTRHAGEDEKGLIESEQALHHLINEEIERGIPSHRIVLAGFSQGGALALFTGLRYEAKLAGVVGLSTYLPTAALVEKSRVLNNTTLPLFLAHGLYDPVVFHDRGTMTKKHLQDWGYTVAWHDYPMQHNVCKEELLQLGRWLTKILA